MTRVYLGIFSLVVLSFFVVFLKISFRTCKSFGVSISSHTVVLILVLTSIPSDEVDYRVMKTTYSKRKEEIRDAHRLSNMSSLI